MTFLNWNIVFRSKKHIHKLRYGKGSATDVLKHNVASHPTANIIYRSAQADYWLYLCAQVGTKCIKNNLAPQWNVGGAKQEGLCQAAIFGCHTRRPRI